MAIPDQGQEVELLEGGLTRRSAVLLMQLRALDKGHVSGRYGTVSEATLCRVEDALKVVTELPKMCRGNISGGRG